MTLQVRRGSDRAEVYSIALSPNVQWLAVSSDKGTVHIFSLRVRVIGEDVPNHSSIDQGPEMAHQNSSTSLDALISPNTGANPSSSLSFMKGKKRHSLSTSAYYMQYKWKLEAHDKRSLNSNIFRISHFYYSLN